MLRLLWAMSVRTRYFLRRYMPTNILLDLIRTRRGLKWGIPAMLLAAPYLLAASICVNLITAGGPGWLNLLVLLFCCYAVLSVMPMMLGRSGPARRGCRHNQSRSRNPRRASLGW